MNENVTNSGNGVNLSASNLPQSDLAGVIARSGKFQGSALRGSDFTGADLTGSSFRGSDVREATFAGANLTDCDFSTLDLVDATFREAILVRTNFSMSGRFCQNSDCLLYTSPSPRDRQKSRMPSSA